MSNVLYKILEYTSKVNTLYKGGLIQKADTGKNRPTTSKKDTYSEFRGEGKAAADLGGEKFAKSDLNRFDDGNSQININTEHEQQSRFGQTPRENTNKPVKENPSVTLQTKEDNRASHVFATIDSPLKRFLGSYPFNHRISTDQKYQTLHSDHELDTFSRRLSDTEHEPSMGRKKKKPQLSFLKEKRSVMNNMSTNQHVEQSYLLSLSSRASHSPDFDPNSGASTSDQPGRRRGILTTSYWSLDGSDTRKKQSEGNGPKTPDEDRRGVPWRKVRWTFPEDSTSSLIDHRDSKGSNEGISTSSNPIQDYPLASTRSNQIQYYPVASTSSVQDTPCRRDSAPENKHSRKKKGCLSLCCMRAQSIDENISENPSKAQELDSMIPVTDVLALQAQMKRQII